MQAASARTGAVLGHDFCTISLSDLLTPWEQIERRIHAAGAGDFVVAFYNPVSRRRRTQLARARDILLGCRDADTPVILAHNLGREESLAFCTLGELDVSMVDMMTTVIVGSSASRRVKLGLGDAVYTPRGYMVDSGKSITKESDTGKSGTKDSNTKNPTPGIPIPGTNPIPEASRRRRRHDCSFHRRGSRRPRSHHHSWPASYRAMPTLPLCRLSCPEDAIAAAPKDAVVIDTAPLTLDDIIDEMEKAHRKGHDVARVHSGDPSLYGAIAEQIRRLAALGIDYTIVPGVSAYAAAAAQLGMELTVPGVAQTLILTRTAMKSSPMPKGEELGNLAKSQATLVIHLSVRNLRQIERDLTPHYGADCPVIVAYRVGWPDQHFIHATLQDVRAKVQKAKITRTALVFVGKSLKGQHDFQDSALYDAAHAHILRPVSSRASETPEA